LAGPLLDLFVGGFAGLMGQFVGLVASRLAACLVGCFAGWLLGWLGHASSRSFYEMDAMLVGGLVGWLCLCLSRFSVSLGHRPPSELSLGK
jgi:hypothetical protein